MFQRAAAGLTCWLNDLYRLLISLEVEFTCDIQSALGSICARRIPQFDQLQLQL